MPNEFLDVREFTNPSPEVAKFREKNKLSTETLLTILQALNPKENHNVEVSRLLNNIQGLQKPNATKQPSDTELNDYIKLLSQDRRNRQQPTYDKNSERFVDSVAIDPNKPYAQTDSGAMEFALAYLSLLGGGKVGTKLARSLGLTTPKGIATNVGMGYGLPLLQNAINSGVNKLGAYTSDPQNALARGFEMLSKNPPTPR